MNCCSQIFFQYSVSAGLWRPSIEYCRVADTRPNRVTEPSIGSALWFGRIVCQFMFICSCIGLSVSVSVVSLSTRPDDTACWKMCVKILFAETSSLQYIQPLVAQLILPTHVIALFWLLKVRKTFTLKLNVIGYNTASWLTFSFTFEYTTCRLNKCHLVDVLDRWTLQLQLYI